MVNVGPGRNPKCWLSHALALIEYKSALSVLNQAMAIDHSNVKDRQFFNYTKHFVIDYFADFNMINRFFFFFFFFFLFIRSTFLSFGLYLSIRDKLQLDMKVII